MKTRNELIRELQESYSLELPDTMEVNTHGYVQQSTNTFICVNGKSTKENEMQKALSFFRDARARLETDTHNITSIEKAQYCKIAEEAINNCLLRHIL